ncbi:MAG: uroporphyrinogen-III C-methyltransferase [Sideroxydans sp.]|nr:uroporphyrinogen-III C-methyltransferase [Sideroxydans sp.]
MNEQSPLARLKNNLVHASLTQLTIGLLVVVFLVQWFFAQDELSKVSMTVAEKLATMDSDNQVNSVLLEKNQEDTRDLAAKLALLEARYAESQGQRAALEALYNELSSSRDETALAEVEQSLLIANQQLQLSANVKAALIAMQTADARLQRMNRNSLRPLRQAIAHDMDKLRALPNVDVAGMSVQLDSLLSSVDELPLWSELHEPTTPATVSAPPASESRWQALLSEIWQELSQLIRIQNTQHAALPLLPPEQEFFLRENLKLHFLLARMNLLARDEVAFKHEIKAMQQWLNDYFAEADDDTKRVLKGLKTLAAASINIELPDIHNSLAQVRNYRASRDKEARNSATEGLKVSE